jgi:hypothetical protein
MRAAVGLIEDVGLAEEASNLAKQAILTQSTAPILFQANSHYGLVPTMLEQGNFMRINKFHNKQNMGIRLPKLHTAVGTTRRSFRKTTT